MKDTAIAFIEMVLVQVAALFIGVSIGVAICFYTGILEW